MRYSVDPRGLRPGDLAEGIGRRRWNVGKDIPTRAGDPERADPYFPGGGDRAYNELYSLEELAEFADRFVELVADDISGRVERMLV